MQQAQPPRLKQGGHACRHAAWPADVSNLPAAIPCQLPDRQTARGLAGGGSSGGKGRSDGCMPFALYYEAPQIGYGRISNSMTCEACLATAPRDMLDHNPEACLTAAPCTDAFCQGAPEGGTWREGSA